VFNDIGPLELVTLAVLAVLIFGPDKLPKVIQDVARTIRKIREFSDSAKQDIRNELGPEFKDFEFEDLNPKTFLRKQLDNDDLGLKEIRNGFDLKAEMAELSDAVHTTAESAATPMPSGKVDMSKPGLPTPGLSTPDLSKKADLTKKPVDDSRPPFDYDAT